MSCRRMSRHFESLARLSGFASPKEFEVKLRQTFELVQGHYSALFESAGELGTDTGSLVFTGGEDDPETIETLERMGFKRASEISATIRGWHFGRYPATRSGKSKELLTELMPQLLSALGAERRSRPGLSRLRQVHRRASRRGSAFFHAEGQSQPA